MDPVLNQEKLEMVKEKYANFLEETTTNRIKLTDQDAEIWEMKSAEIDTLIRNTKESLLSIVSARHESCLNHPGLAVYHLVRFYNEIGDCFLKIVEEIGF